MEQPNGAPAFRREDDRNTQAKIWGTKLENTINETLITNQITTSGPPFRAVSDQRSFARRSTELIRGEDPWTVCEIPGKYVTALAATTYESAA